MATTSSISDSDLLARLPSLVQAELTATAEVIEHLVEVERRRLFLDQACSSLYAFLTERLGYTEDEAITRVRVTRLALRFPQVIEELRSGAIHLTGLFLLSNHLTEQNTDTLLAEARGKSRRELGRLIASWFPKPDVSERITSLLDVTPRAPADKTTEVTWSDPGNRDHRPRLEPLSATSYRIEFTASAELRDKIERARELLSHALPSGDLAALFGRALDELIRQETRHRHGSGEAGGVAPPRQHRQLKPGSRHIPVHVARLVWERDRGQCTFVNNEGERCSARRFVTLEHCQPFALGGPADPANLRLLCVAHNHHTARQVFGEAHITKKRAQCAPPAHAAVSSEPENPDRAQGEARPRHGDVYDKVQFALRELGFREREASKAMAQLKETETEVEPLLRAALKLLTWKAA